MGYGDFVAILIAIGFDYFYSLVKANGSVSKSALRKNNIAWLKADHDFKTILPEDLRNVL
jgi:hypothetical protein